jgi:hypothetical protein
MTSRSDERQRRMIDKAERALLDVETLALLLNDLIGQLRDETRLLREGGDGQ